MQEAAFPPGSGHKWGLFSLSAQEELQSPSVTSWDDSQIEASKSSQVSFAHGSLAANITQEPVNCVPHSLQAVPMPLQPFHAHPVSFSPPITR